MKEKHTQEKVEGEQEESPEDILNSGKRGGERRRRIAETLSSSRGKIAEGEIESIGEGREGVRAVDTLS